MNIPKYILLAIISFFAHNSSCSMFFTQAQIAAAEGKKAPSSPVKKKPSTANGSITYQPRQTFSYDPHSPLFERVANDYVQQAYANWGLESDDKGKDILLSSGETNLLNSQEKEMQ